MLPPGPRKYVLTALSGTPDVLEGLLSGVGSGDPLWDFRPDPDRFTLREVLAHLADWEPIWHERMVRTRDEDRPSLPDIDEGRYAVERDYAHSDPLANLARFRTGRAALTDLLRALPEPAWARIGHREGIGDLTLEQQAVYILGHDGYHTQQVAQWLASYRKGPPQ